MATKLTYPGCADEVRGGGPGQVVDAGHQLLRAGLSQARAQARRGCKLLCLTASDSTAAKAISVGRQAIYFRGGLRPRRSQCVEMSVNGYRARASPDCVNNRMT
ncbi:hypothetical protein RR48_13958 [Papilio machaon]|uniref:Uncharacterized protein n=1 Tax=Papilio machaon TaxID=76193 RepID=A0A194RHR1_PAPMA|nr:hypothetical protein RR48_13958 [Papilio machaon]